MSFPIGGPLKTNLYLLTVSAIFNVECNAMVEMTTCKQRSRSFWYQSISHIRLSIGFQ